MKNASKIFAFLLEKASQGQDTALVTIVDVFGSSARAPGTHMGVSADGKVVGSISSGCVEATVVGEAKRVMAVGLAERLRLGAGSRFIDISLPCGGGLDLLVTPNPSPNVLSEALARLRARQSVQLMVGKDVALFPAGSQDQTGTGESVFIQHEPDLRLIILGHGQETAALTMLARQYGAEVLVLSPDNEVLENTRLLGAQIVACHERGTVVTANVAKPKASRAKPEQTHRFESANRWRDSLDAGH